MMMENETSNGGQLRVKLTVRFSDSEKPSKSPSCSTHTAKNKTKALSSDDKPIKFDRPQGLTKNDIEQDALYSNTFEAKFYTKSTIPKDHLPYGLICTKENLNIEENWDIVYNDCLRYITDSKDKYEWYHDFIAFTNLQIACYNNSNLLQDDEGLDLVLNFTNKHVRNLRSSVARNALSFTECMIANTCHNQPLLTTISLRLMPTLFTLVSSEKKVLRDPAKELILYMCINNADFLNTEVFWQLLEHCHHKNRKVTTYATQCVKSYLDNYNGNFNDLDLVRLTTYLEYHLQENHMQIKDVTTIIWNELLSTSHEVIDILYHLIGDKPLLLDLIYKMKTNRTRNQQN